MERTTPRRRLARSLAGAALVAGLAASGTAVPAWAEPVAAADPAPGSVTPDKDPFYLAPADIGAYRPGQIVATRPLTLKLSVEVRAWQISYRSNDSHGRPTLEVTTLAVPTKAWEGTGPRPAVSVQFAEDSTGIQCAPSYKLSTGGGSSEAGLLLNKNWAVAIPDHQGFKSAWMAGPRAGHSVLDGIRAVRSFQEAGLASSQWGLTGYSGGAHATGWAAELQPSYAPDVTLAGVAMGGTPADPAATARFLDGRAPAGFVFAATWGIHTEWPEAGIEGLLNAQGRIDMATVAGKCLPDILGKFPFRRLASATTVPDPLSVPSVAAVLKKDTMGAATPKAPIFNYHAVTDEIVPIGQANTLTKTWCAGGATIQIVRSWLGEHGLEAVRRSPAAVSYLNDRFAGKTPPNSC
ncbi:secretory lipase [Thermomonospora umbrina]|uniref:Secretory lipase n=2 Tax=Thermomonospora umbrina TaxID=111806 RepID=A0A3D9T3G0_9ACTN|nr:secretory lipase [Thermomonospora umbrina]